MEVKRREDEEEVGSDWMKRSKGEDTVS